MKIIKGFSRDYWLYWIATAFAEGASNILQYLLSLYVLDLTGSGTLFAAMLSVIVVPRLILGPIAGVMADRVRRIRLMSGVLFAEAVLLAVYMLLGQRQPLSVVLICVLVVLMECVEIFYNASASAILPELVPPEKLKDAISVSKVDDGVVVVACPMLAALLYSHVPIAAALGVVALINLLAGILQCFIRPKYEAKREVAASRSFLQNFREGVAFAKKDAFVRAMLISLPLCNAFFGAAFSVGVMYLFREVYGISTYAYGLYCSVTASMSLIVPVLVLPYVKKSRPNKIYPLMTALIGVEVALIGGMAFLGISGTLPALVTVVLITLLDCMTIAEAMPMQMCFSIMLQTRVSKELLGRVSSLVKVVSVASVSAGQILFGLLMDTFPAWLPLVLAGCCIGMSSLVFRLNTRRVE